MKSYELSDLEIETLRSLQTILNLAPTMSREYILARAAVNRILYGTAEGYGL